MSLFIGNIANAITAKELEALFSKFGKCKINYKGAYAFAEGFSLQKIKAVEQIFCSCILSINNPSTAE